MEPGLYNKVVTDSLLEELKGTSPDFVDIREIGTDRVADRISQYISKTIKELIQDFDPEFRNNIAKEIANSVALLIQAEYPSIEFDALGDPLKELLAVHRSLPDGRPNKIEIPFIPLNETALITNSKGEPGLSQQIGSEVDSADSIEAIIAFIRKSGIQPILRELEKHLKDGKRLRVLTTTYTGSTELEALKLLTNIGAEVRVSYEVDSTRLHAKAWKFSRSNGASTAYIGSSNLTFSAQRPGKEWNIRISEESAPGALEKFSAVFESYWNSSEFEDFSEEKFRKAIAHSTDRGDKVFILPGFGLRLEPFQEALLEKFEFSRSKGNHRNLLVSATGTGKTVMAAVDYSRLSKKMTSSKLLFLAHREEILNQSIGVFRYAMEDPNFGELWIGSSEPQNFDHVFASVQKMARVDLEKFDPSQFDVIVIDEFHHAAAQTYQRLLKYFKPAELIGLTATPERSDGLDIYQWFGGQASAELRLWDAIDQDRLTPFNYFGIFDGLDLTSVPWKRGQGYETNSLSNLYVSSDFWVRRAISETVRLVPNLNAMKALGFCVDVQHAEFTSAKFNEAGFRTIAISAATPGEVRKNALSELSSGKLQIIFSVDIFNEGVDIPNVNTLLMLRPTQSGTLFIQQLGRGLRKSPEKDVCTVLDFIGNNRVEFKFDQKYRALLGFSRRELQGAILGGFPLLPSGCYFELDKKTRESVLNSIKYSLPSNWTSLVKEVQSLASGRENYRLENFLEDSDLTIQDIYRNGKCWTDLIEAAGLVSVNSGQFEKVLRSSIGRMLHIDDGGRISFYIDLLNSLSGQKSIELSPEEIRLVRMLVGSLFSSLKVDLNIYQALEILREYGHVVDELIQVLAVLQMSLGRRTSAWHGRENIPLELHARYSRIEIQASVGDGSELDIQVPVWREGVKQIKGENVEILLITFDKSNENFSSSTSYRDYAISETLIHWESQSTTSSSSPTARRYRNHLNEDRKILLFARTSSDDRAFYFLGSGRFVSAEGSNPISVVWELEQKMPADLYLNFAAAVA